jgi:hypothetical protein
VSGDLTREELDRLAIDNEGRVVFGCSTHPGLPLTTIYQDGVVRMLCPADGFEVARIKVAAASTQPLPEQPLDTGEGAK